MLEEADPRPFYEGDIPGKLPNHLGMLILVRFMKELGMPVKQMRTETSGPALHLKPTLTLDKFACEQPTSMRLQGLLLPRLCCN